MRLLPAIIFLATAAPVAHAQLASAGATPTTSTQLFGDVRNGNYTAPEGRFRIAIPVLPELGGQIHDTENVVTFDDDVSVHVSIACFPLDLSQKWELETREIRDYLTFFYSSFVYSEFERRHPGAANEQSLFSPDLKGGALFVFTLLPGGSYFANGSNVVPAPADAPLVAKRGTLLFVENGCIFVLSLELAERITQRSTFDKTAVQENEILRDRLIELVQRMHIPAPRPSSRRLP